MESFGVRFFQKDISANTSAPDHEKHQSSFQLQVTAIFSPILDQFSTANQQQTASTSNSVLHTTAAANDKVNTATKEVVKAYISTVNSEWNIQQ